MTRKLFVYGGAFVAILALFVSVSVGTTNLLGGFDHYEEPSLEEKKVDLINVLSDGEFDQDLFLANLSETDLSNLGEYVRPVAVVATRDYTEDEVLEILQELYPDEGLETVEDIPQGIRDQMNADGILSTPIAQNQANGFLANGQVIVPLQIFGQILQVPAEEADKIHVEVTALANPEVEDDWKQETLFSGTAREFVADDGVKFDNEQGLTFLMRPNAQVLVESDGYPYDAAELEEVSSSSAVVWGSSNRTASANVSQVVTDNGIVVLSGTFGAQDFGMPVFALLDGEPVWVGVIVAVLDSHTAVVVGAESVQAKALQR